jgi:PAS domain S-box-containing protein
VPLELLPGILIIAIAIAGGIALRRAHLGSTGAWAWAWAALFASALSFNLIGQLPGAVFLSPLFGTLFAVFLLVGAIHVLGTSPPSWLLPVGLGAGALRGALELLGASEVSSLLALLIEPTAELAAAALLLRSTESSEAPLARRLLAPSFLLIAAVDGWSALSDIRGLPWEHMLVPWISVGIVAVPIQTLALIYELRYRLGLHSRGRRAAEEALRASKRDLERRVEQRTAELAAANEDLREQIEERHRAERALRESQEHYRHASELASDFCYEVRVDARGRYSEGWVTGAFERITGYTPREVEVLGVNFVHPEDQELVKARFLSAATGRPVQQEYRILTRSGATRWLSEQVRAIPDPERGDTLVYGAAHDITASKQEEARRRELESRVLEARKLESLGVLAGGIAHDFNNLLTVILGNTAILLRDLPKHSPLRPRAARIRKTAEVAAGLTEQMLTYSGGTSFTPKPIDLSYVAEDMISLLESQIAENVRLERDFAPQLPRVEGDETQLRQVVMNLVSNAAEATAVSGGVLSVSTRLVEVDDADLVDAYPRGDHPPGPYAVLEVRDTGPGMDEETRARIFEPFFSTKFSGRGLGLAAVLGIVRSHRGAILVESIQGSGTAFRVYLPPLEAEEEAAVEPDPSALEPHSEAVVLVVEDDEAVREVTQTFLERAGLRVWLADGGHAALRLLEERGEEVGLVLLDFAMPDLDGLQVLDQIRRTRPELPVILATGYTAQAAVRRAAEGAFTGVIQKPFDPDMLVLRVRDAIALRAGA